jgi:hypothetical protein
MAYMKSPFLSASRAYQSVPPLQLNMAATLSAIVLAFAAQTVVGQLADRGFPDCANGPLKDNLVCDMTAGEYSPDMCASSPSRP